MERSDVAVDVGEVETEIVVTGGTDGGGSVAEDRVVGRVLELLRREMAEGAARRRETSVRDRSFDVPR